MTLRAVCRELSLVRRMRVWKAGGWLRGIFGMGAVYVCAL